MKTTASVQKKSQSDGALVQRETASAGPDGAAIAPNLTGMPDALKSGVESLSGMSLDAVKVHYNSSKPAALEALAYAQGQDIHLGPGQERHLPHEAWHVVQQAQGRVQPTMQMQSGTQINDDQGLEHEADVMGAKALKIPFGKSIEKQELTSDPIQKMTDPMASQSEQPYSTLPQTQNGTTIQMRATWAFNQSARRHYNDAWGRAYGIRNDEQLKDAIRDEGNWDEGNQRIDLGVYNPTGARNGARDCYIRFNNSYARNRDGHTYTWHCGPAL